MLDVLDKLIKKLAKPDAELRFVYEAGPCGYVIYRRWSPPVVCVITTTSNFTQPLPVPPLPII